MLGVGTEKPGTQGRKEFNLGVEYLGNADVEKTVLLNLAKASSGR